MPAKVIPLYSYKYSRPALTVDAAVFGIDTDEQLKILLIQRSLEPYVGSWALPGGFMRVGESAEDAVRRELTEEASITPRTLEQVAVYSDPNRDPREHVVSIAYLGLVRLSDHKIRGGSDASAAAWFAIEDMPSLAFDHEHIISDSLEKLRTIIKIGRVGMDLLPDKFPLRALQSLHEQVLGRALDKRNFRRQVLEQGILVELDSVETNVQHRAARLYRFNKRATRTQL